MNNFHDPYERLRGKRYIAIVRCSTYGQADTSTPDQLRLVRLFAARYGLIEVAVENLDGLTGSIPGNRQDLQRLLTRKQTRNDFDLILLQDTSRFTRGGIKHGNHLEFSFEADGIEIIFVMEQMVGGTAGELYKSFQYYAAQEQARSTGKNVARGSMSAIENGQVSHTRRPPFAVDKLYVGYDERPHVIIRNLSDGTQLKIDPQSGAVIERLGRNPKTGKPAHYIKQKDEKIRLIMGDPILVDAVRLMFKRLLIDRWGGWKIASELDSMGIPSASGKRWNKNSVMCILRNQIYLGIGIANRKFGGIYYNRGRNGEPNQVAYDLQYLAKHKRAKTSLRPQSDWIEVPQKDLENFLPSDLRELAAAYQSSYWSARDQKRSLPKKTKHVNSSFFLSDILKSKQGKQPMSGKPCGPKGHKVRYYMVKVAQRCPIVDNPLWRRMIRAGYVEQLVLHLLRQTILSAPNLKAIIRKQIENLYGQAEGNAESRATLSAKQAKLCRRRTFVIENLDVIGDVEGRHQIAEIKDELSAIERQITEMTAEPWDADRIKQTVDDLIHQLQNLGRGDEVPSMVKLRNLAALFINRLEVDLENESIEIDFGLPKWALEMPKMLSDPTRGADGVSRRGERQ